MTNLLGERDGLRVVFDDRRGYARLETLPSQAEIDRLYDGSFWAAKADPKTGRSEQAVRREQAAWWDLHYGDWLELAHDVAEIKLRYALDVGCGFGYFVRACLADGLGATGIDVNGDALSESERVLRLAGAAVDEGRRVYQPAVPGAPEQLVEAWGGLNGQAWRILCSTIQTAPIIRPYAPYDLISALWVMEHLLEPEMFLRQVYERLERGGVFIAAVPSDFSYYQMLCVDDRRTQRPYWWIDPTHLNYWTPATFANLLGRHGFRVAALTTMYQMELFVAGGLDYPADPEVGRTCHADVRAHDSALTREQRVEYYLKNATSGIGREIVAICIKE